MDEIKAMGLLLGMMVEHDEAVRDEQQSEE